MPALAGSDPMVLSRSSNPFTDTNWSVSFQVVIDLGGCVHAVMMSFSAFDCKDASSFVGPVMNVSWIRLISCGSAS